MLKILLSVFCLLALSGKSALAYTLVGRAANGGQCWLLVEDARYENGKFVAEVSTSFQPKKAHRVMGNPRVFEMVSVNDHGFPTWELSIALRAPAGPKGLMSAHSYRLRFPTDFQRPRPLACRGLRLAH